MADLKIYMAGTVWFGIAKGQPEYRKLTDPRLIQIAEDVPHRLDSYHYIGEGRRYREFINAETQVFLDSGAFSAHTLGVEIDLVGYCEYIKSNKKYIIEEEGVVLASVLDGIGDPLLTYQNQMKMESNGVRPIPCFHAGEDERYLEWYLQRYEYIALGGLVGGSTNQLQIWLDRIWSRYLMDERGNPRVKVHGFGITSIPLMERYPWWSCDSTSWIQTAAFGGITIPWFGNLDVSKESPNKHVRGKHISNLTDIESSRVIGYLDQNGFDWEYIRDSYHGRACFNLWSYQQIQHQINQKRLDKGQPLLAQELF